MENDQQQLDLFIELLILSLKSSCVKCLLLGLLLLLDLLISTGFSSSKVVCSSLLLLLLWLY